MVRHLFARCLCVLLLVLCLSGSAAWANEQRRPNVLFIAIDDLNMDLGCYGRSDIKSPNIDRLAARGVRFTNAHCPAPTCGPSRTAILTGKLPATTGVYGNNQWWVPSLPEIVTLPRHFKASGYYVAGAGKIHHHTAGNNPPEQWDAYFDQVFDNPWELQDPVNYPTMPPAEAPPGYPFSGLPQKIQEFDWGVLPIEEREYGDVLATDWIIEQLQTPREQPMFLALGIYRPHVPMYVPQRFFDLYPLKALQMPVFQEGDLDDVPPAGRALADARGWFKLVREQGKWAHAVQAYYASISFADAQVGRVLDALDRNGLTENTIIVLWSDHGFHLGEKSHLFKQTLWERSTRVPLIVVAPGQTSPDTKCDRPVNLVDLYATLNTLCGLTEVPDLDSKCLAHLLRDPQSPRERPALISLLNDNFAVISDRWHYIRYADGGQELYDRHADPHQWTNLADRAEHAAEIEELRQAIPQSPATPVPTKRAFRFDHTTYTFTPRPSRE
jgi:arylsulfatase A-like enzyme